MYVLRKNSSESRRKNTTKNLKLLCLKTHLKAVKQAQEGLEKQGFRTISDPHDNVFYVVTRPKKVNPKTLDRIERLLIGGISGILDKNPPLPR